MFYVSGDGSLTCPAEAEARRKFTEDAATLFASDRVCLLSLRRPARGGPCQGCRPRPDTEALRLRGAAQGLQATPAPEEAGSQQPSINAGRAQASRFILPTSQTSKLRQRQAETLPDHRAGAKHTGLGSQA